MQKKHFFGTGIIAFLVVASFLVLDHSAASETDKGATCCKKAIKRCSEEVNPTDPTQKGSENDYPGSSSLIFNFSS